LHASSRAVNKPLCFPAYQNGGSHKDLHDGQAERLLPPSITQKLTITEWYNTERWCMSAASGLL